MIRSCDFRLQSRAGSCRVAEGMDAQSMQTVDAGWHDRLILHCMQ